MKKIILALKLFIYWKRQKNLNARLQQVFASKHVNDYFLSLISAERINEWSVAEELTRINEGSQECLICFRFSAEGRIISLLNKFVKVNLPFIFVATDNREFHPPTPPFPGLAGDKWKCVILLSLLARRKEQM